MRFWLGSTRLSACVVWLGARLALSTPVFAAVNLALIAVWIVVVAAVGREHRRRNAVLDQRTAQGLDGMGTALP